MKTIIKNILTETVMEKIISTLFPKLNNLKSKSNYSTKLFGYNIIYYDKDDMEYYFRLTEAGRRSILGFNDEGKPALISKDFPKTLYVNGRTYDEMRRYIPNDEMILNWFNTRYNQNAERVVRKSPLKRL